MSGAIKLRAVPSPPHEQPPPQRPSGARPDIYVGEELHIQRDQAVEALRADPDLWHRDGRLVRIVRLGASEHTPERPEGTPEIRAHTPASLRFRLSEFARWIKMDRRSDPPKETYVAPPGNLAAGLLDLGMWPALRRLEGVIETPAIAPDGSVIDKPGWDRGTGLLYAPLIPLEPILDAPTQRQAHAALRALQEPFKDFPYSKPGEEHVAIAAILTLLARPAILGAVPAFVFDASDRGAGKSLQVQALTRIATGRWSRPRTFPSEGGRVDEAELAKVLGAVALSGSPIIDFDNVRVAVDGAPLLLAITTQDEGEFRVLGESRDVKAAWRAITLIGGNNLAIGDEMSRRCLIARLEPDERPELRADLPSEQGGFTHPRLREWVTEQRAHLLRAGLTLLRAWFVAGRPRQATKTKASFEAWSDIIPHAILWAGGPDIRQFEPATSEDDEPPEKAALRTVLTLWPRLEGPSGSTVAHAVRTLYPGNRRPSWRSDADYSVGEKNDGLDELRDALEVLAPPRRHGDPPGGRLGEVFRGFKGTKIGGKFLKALGKTGGKVRWKVATREVG